MGIWSVGERREDSFRCECLISENEKLGEETEKELSGRLEENKSIV